MPDAHFEVPRLAELYDSLHPDRSDLDFYAGIAEEFQATSILDIGCGTGTFACLLAMQGLEVTGVDPAAASLDVARRKPGADRVRWLHGYATGLPPLAVSLVTMTGNVAQVFLTDDEWLATLRAARRALHRDGRLVFEVRDPSRRAWQAWTWQESFATVSLPGVGNIEHWVEVTEVTGQLVTFTTTFDIDGETLSSHSTLRFREYEDVEASLRSADLRLLDVRDAPDRPGLEFVFITGRCD